MEAKKMEMKLPRYLLPVSAEESASWRPEIPKKLENSCSDHVSFHATDSQGQTQTSTDAACYSRLGRDKLDTYRIHCRPKQKPKALSLKDAQTFFLIMARYRVVPEGIHLWRERNGVHCVIPERAGPAANVYAALTCYRWVDAHPRLVWEFLRILEQDIPRHPLQILPYLINQHVSNCNHSFITTKGWSIEREGYERATNPTLGLAAKILFDRNDPRGEEVFAPGSTAHCNTIIGKISQEIAPGSQVESQKRWGPRQYDIPRYILEKPEDGLHPSLYQLYTQPNITPEQIREILSGLFTKEKT